MRNFGNVITAALTLLVLSGCNMWDWGEDPLEYGIGTKYYTITFDGNGNTNGKPPASIKAADSSYITLPGQGNMAKTDYTFGGWGTNSYSNYPIGTSYMVTNRVTLYAIWTTKKRTVTYNGNGTTVGVPQSITVDS